MNVEEQVKIAVKTLDDKQAEDLMIIDISEVSSLGDYFILATGKNINHVRALSDYVTEALEKKGIFCKQPEGYSTANWILLDYGDYMIHIFDRESRDYYRLERIWRDAKFPEVKDFLSSEA